MTTNPCDAGGGSSPCGRIRRQRRAQGELVTIRDLRNHGKPAARAYDALLAAVAIANDFSLYTVNPDDFTSIKGLRIVAVTHPDRPAAS